MITAIRRRIRTSGTQAGITLIELLVAMIVFGILSSIVVSLYTASNKSVISTSTSDQNTQAASNIMAELSRVIRGATTNPTTGGGESPAIISGTASTLSLYSYVDSSALTPTPFYVQFTINSTNGQLVEKRWPASTDANGLFTYNTANTPSLTRTFPGKLTVTAPLFSYADQTGTVLGGTVAASDLDNVASVTVDVVAQTSNYTGVLPATIQNTVGMPNVTLEDNT